MLGYMEQSVATALTKALTAVGCFKPKYPFVDAKKSALLYIAYHLKGKSDGYRVGPLRETTCLRYKFYRFFFLFQKFPLIMVEISLVFRILISKISVVLSN